jgi:hypothetical protein
VADGVVQETSLEALSRNVGGILNNDIPVGFNGYSNSSTLLSEFRKEKFDLLTLLQLMEIQYSIPTQTYEYRNIWPSKLPNGLNIHC